MAKKEPKEFKKLNEVVGVYGGLYANWKSGGFQKPIPPYLLETMSMLSEELGTYFDNMEKKVD